MNNFFLNIKKDDKVTSQEVGELRIAVGWKSLEKKLDKAISNSLCTYSIRDKVKLVGFVRIIGDGTIHAHIIDLMIHPDYQKKGLGKHLIKKVIDDLRDEKYDFISVTFSDELSEFYEKLGFAHRKGGIIELVL